MHSCHHLTMRKSLQVKIDDCPPVTEYTAATVTDKLSTLNCDPDVLLRRGSMQVKHRDDVICCDAPMFFHQFDNPVNPHRSLFMSFWSWHR